MKKIISDLVALQGIDLKVRDLETVYHALPGKRAELVAEFEVIRKKHLEAQEQMNASQRKIRATEGMIADEQERLKAAKIKSGTLKKAAEIEALTAEIKAIEGRISDHETEILLTMDELDAKKNTAFDVEQEYNRIGRRVQQSVRAIDAEKKQILVDVARLTEESKKARRLVGQALLADYQRLLEKGKGIPLAEMGPGGLCTNCSLRLAPETLNGAMKGNIVNCDNCGCMVYDPNA